MLQFCRNATTKPIELVTGLCVMVVAASGGAVKDAASTAFAVLFILSMFYIKSWVSVWQKLERIEKMLLTGFVLYALSGLISLVNVSDYVEFVKQFGRYIRFVVIIPVYLMMRLHGMKLSRFFLVGIVLSGFIYFGFSIYDVWRGSEVSGQYHRITFSNAIMLNVGILGLMLMVGMRKPLYDLIIGTALLCGFYAVLLSESRGSWMILPVYMIFITVHAVTNKKTSIVKLSFAGLLILILIPFTSVVDLIYKRYDAAVSDLILFKNQENYNTSLGTRLALWDIAYHVWQEHPVVGTGLGDFNEDMVRYQKLGKYPGVYVNGATHNIYFQALAGTGGFGLLVMCYALIIAPLYFFIKSKHAVGDSFVKMGYLLVVSYAVFGLSESWMLRAPVVSVFIIYTITLAAIIMNAKSEAVNFIKIS